MRMLKWGAGVVLVLGIIFAGFLWYVQCPCFTNDGELQDGAGESVTDLAELDGRSLRLVGRDGVCVLSDGSDEVNVPLKVGAPCAFLRQQGDLMVRTLPEYSIEGLFVVLGTPVDDDVRERWGLPPEAHCSLQAQGVVVNSGEIIPVDHVTDGGLWCRDAGVDLKRFLVFAEHFDPDDVSE